MASALLVRSSRGCCSVHRLRLQAVLFQTQVTDVSAAAATGGVLLAAAGIACVAPARRAARVSPTEGLKAD